MNVILRASAALAAVVLASLSAQAQDDPIIFGKPKPADFTAAPFVGDSAAAAVVLCDYGTTSFQYISNDFQLVTERVTRIKILKKAGYDVATVKVPLYHRESNTEKISGLRGTTYNMVNGQLVKTKLDGSNMFSEDLTPNVRVRKFTMPDVREGSVIEYAYTVTSDFFFNFQDWTFQREIPVRWSEYRANIPEYFHYKMLQQGYHPLAVRTAVENSTQFIVHTWGVYSGSGPDAARTTGGNQAVTAKVTNYRWAMKDLPAFRDEPFMTTSDDYMDRINFQLAGEQFPGQPYKNVAGDWSKINTELLTEDNFGSQLNRGNFLKDQVLPLVAKYPATEARAAAVRQVVMNAVRYDGTNRYSTDGSLRKAFDAHHGTSADVNLLLIAALRDAGLMANPVLLSTRSHGHVNQTLPLLSQFNYVVAHVALADGKDLLLDATDPLLPGGMLPERCLNQVGRLVMPEGKESRWLDLTPSQRRVHYQQVQLALSPEGALSGKVHEEYSGYAGATARTELETLGESKYRTQFAGKHAAWTVPKFTISERTNLLKPLVLDYEFAQPAEEAASGALYLNPFAEFASEQNPFRHENRTFPVDFGAMQDETMLLTVSLPAGYELAEMPKPAVVDLPDNGGRFFYTIAATGGAVNITSRLSLRKPVYTADDYQYLRELYRLMLAKQSEKLVLKKKA